VKSVDLKGVVDVTTVSDHGRTNIPASIRLKLGLKDGDKILWFWFEGEVFLRKV